MINLICTVCGGHRALGRRQCHSCYKKAAIERSRIRHQKGIRTRYEKKCAVCRALYSTTHKNSILCIKCYSNNRALVKSSTIYKFIGKNIRLHRAIAEERIGRQLYKNEHIHHLDGDTLNNSLTNLVIVSNSDHARLHRYLDLVLAVLNKDKGMTLEDLKKAKKDSAIKYMFDRDIPVKKLWIYNAPMGELVDPGE
jgi:hypothetical protein